MALPPLPDIFGNYAVAKLEHLVEPGAISFWPTAPGWRFALALVLVWLGYLAWRRWQKWRRNRYRRKALALLQQCRKLPAEQQVQACARLLKSAALAAFPRNEIAALSGSAWLDWLEQRGSAFSEDSRRILSEGQYRAPQAPDPELVDQLTRDTANWLKTHPEAA